MMRRGCKSKAFKHGGVLLTLFLLAGLGVKGVTGEWMSYKGCWEFKSNGSSAKILSYNDPSTCLDACPENTTVLALQGHVCDCLTTIPGKRYLKSNCTCSESLGEDCNVSDISKWQIYQQATSEDLPGITLEPQSSPKCLAVINTRKLTFESLDCNTSLPALCFRNFPMPGSDPCDVTMGSYDWSRAKAGCRNEHRSTFAIGSVKVARCLLLNGVNSKKYWTAYIFLQRHKNHISTIGVLPTATMTTYPINTSPSSILPSFSMPFISSSQSETSTLMLLTMTPSSESPLLSLPTASSPSVVQPTASTTPENISKSPLLSTSTIASSVSSAASSVKQSEVSTSSSPIVSTVTVSGTTSTKALTNISNSSSSPLMISTTPIHAATTKSTGSIKVHETETTSTSINDIQKSKSSATSASQNKQDSLEKQVAILEYSLGTLAALLVAVIGIGAWCMVRMNRELKESITKLQIDEQPIYRETSGRNGVFTDSGTVNDFYGDGLAEMEETEFGPNSLLPTSGRPSYLHNGLTASGRETSVLF